MRESDFARVKNRLLCCGIAPRHANRTVGELQDHYHDLLEEAVGEGVSIDDARTRADTQLGEMEVLVAEMESRRELKSWAFRHPHTALVLYPLGCIAMLPVVPIIAGVERATDIARWGTSLLLAGVVTASMLLILQLSIVLG